MRTILGYGRYPDDPQHVGCPRAKSDMSPCIARDGSVALADSKVCVMCGVHPRATLGALLSALNEGAADKLSVDAAADELAKIVRLATEPLEPT